jgi:hypothetical protein
MKGLEASTSCMASRAEGGNARQATTTDGYRSRMATGLEPIGA